jgi:hypothetical protein
LAIADDELDSGRLTNVRLLWTEIALEFGSSKDPRVRSDAYRAGVQLGELLGAIGEQGEALRHFEEILSSQGDLGESAELDRAWFYGHQAWFLAQIRELRFLPLPFQAGQDMLATILDRYGGCDDIEVSAGLATTFRAVG